MKMDERYSPVRDIMIMTTHMCNLHCDYCYYSKVTTSDLPDVECFKKLLLKEFEKKIEKFKIAFHGGEPFLNWGFIKAISEWVWTLKPTLQIRVTTNGTVCTDEIKAWLKLHRHHFTAVLSIDGPAAIHNLGRPGSFERIDKNFFVETYPDMGVKMTVASFSLPHLFESFLYLHNQGFYVNPSLAREVDWDVPNDLYVYQGELQKLSKWYLENPNVPPGDLLGFSFLPPMPQQDERRKCACGAGRDMVAYDVDGVAYPCHSFINLSVPMNNELRIECFKLLAHNDAKLLESPCCDCLLARWCSPCYGLSLMNRGSMGKLDPSYCLFSALTIIEAAFLQAQMLTSNVDYRFLHRYTKQELSQIAHVTLEVLKVKDKIGSCTFSVGRPLRRGMNQTFRTDV